MNFGTRDLRHANLSHRAGSHLLPSSPTKVHASSSTPAPESTTEPERAPHSSVSLHPSEPFLITTPTSDVFFEEHKAPIAPDRLGPDFTTASSAGLVNHNHDNGPTSWSSRNSVESREELDQTHHSHSNSVDTLSPLSRFPASMLSKASPLASTSTGTPMGGGFVSGTRYGVALTGQRTGGSMARAWGASTPTCGKCGRNVYFAEQVKAAGKTFHKGCLRCAECNTSLDSTRLTEKDGRPLCRRCYGKVGSFSPTDVRTLL